MDKEHVIYEQGRDMFQFNSMVATSTHLSVITVTKVVWYVTPDCYAIKQVR